MPIQSRVDINKKTTHDSLVIYTTCSVYYAVYIVKLDTVSLEYNTI